MNALTRQGCAVAAMIATLTAPTSAQLTTAAALAPSSDAAAVTTAPATAIPSLLVVAGGSTVVQTEFPVTRIAVTNPEIADATVIDPQQVLVDGKTSGSVSLIVWGKTDMVQYA